MDFTVECFLGMAREPYRRNEKQLNERVKMEEYKYAACGFRSSQVVGNNQEQRLPTPSTASQPSTLWYSPTSIPLSTSSPFLPPIPSSCRQQHHPSVH